MNYKFTKDMNKGFTLIELLVVISIIAILSVIAITLFGSAQKNARDARRHTEIDSIANALETMRTSGSAYYSGTLTATSFTGGTFPVDNGNTANNTTSNPQILPPRYCIITAVSGAAMNGEPTTWSSNTNCPSAPAGYNVLSDPAALLANTSSWRVCTRLEASTADTGAGLLVDCRPSAQ